MTTDNAPSTPTGSPPVNPNSDSDDEKVTLTKAELNAMLEAKLKGSGKEIKKLQTELQKAQSILEERAKSDEEAKRAQLVEEGKKDELLNLISSEKESLAKQFEEAQARLKAYEEREAARSAALAEDNAAKIKSLPKELQAIVPKGLNEEGLHDYLVNLEKLIVTKPQHIFGSGGVRMNGAPEDPFVMAKQKSRDWLYSANKKKGS
jgi:hypothetical protein